MLAGVTKWGNIQVEGPITGDILPWEGDFLEVTEIGFLKKCAGACLT